MGSWLGLSLGPITAAANDLPDIHANTIANWITAALAGIVCVLLKMGINSVLKRLDIVEETMRQVDKELIAIKAELHRDQKTRRSTR